MPPNLSLYLGVFLVSLATLAYELYLVRIFSITQWYHFASMVISIALFGFAASGTFLYILKGLERLGTHMLLFLCSLGFALTSVLSLPLTNMLTFHPLWQSFDILQGLNLAGYYLFLGVPFFFAGLVMCIAFSRMPQNISKLYFSNMLGSGLGCLAILLVIPTFAHKSPLLVGAIGLAGALSFGTSLPKGINVITGLCGICLGIPLFLSFPGPKLSLYKSLTRIRHTEGSQVLKTHWSPISRVDLVKSPVVRYAPGLSLTYQEPIPEQLGILIDADRMDAVTKYEEGLKFISRLPCWIAYRLKRGGTSLIIEAGGGLSVLAALQARMKKITVLESDPYIVRLLKGELKAFSGGIYQRQDVKVLVTDARSFLRASSDKFDVIEIALRESIFATTSGIGGLCENYLFTIQAIRGYLKHLSDQGVLSITRWLAHPPRESLRLFATIYFSLKDLGIAYPQRHILVFRTLTTFTILTKKIPFSSDEIDSIKGILDKNRFDIVWYQGIKENELNRYLKFSQESYYLGIKGFLEVQNKDDFFEAYPFDITPVTDNRPFFSNYFKPDKLEFLLKEMRMHWEPFLEGTFVTLFILAQSLILCTIFIFMPMFFRRYKARNKRALLYFFLIGTGFMLLEMPLLQFFILFLGHPVYASSAVIFSLLVGSSLGSFTSRYLTLILRKAVFAVLPFLGIATMLVLPLLLNKLPITSITLRYLICVISLLPLGFVMGIPFPVGIGVLARVEKGLIPWGWCINGCASVISPVAATGIAIYLGFFNVLVIGCLAYLAAGACILSSLSR